MQLYHGTAKCAFATIPGGPSPWDRRLGRAVALANGVLIPLANISGIDISVQNDMPPGSAGTVHLVVDVTGYFQ